MDEVDIGAYGRDYRPDPGPSVADHGIRGGDRYVQQHDPLRGVAVATSGAAAGVHLGVDPGTFYCADQLANLIAWGRTAGAAVGFIHVPPDRSTSAVAAAAGHLADRAATMEQCARVVATAIRGMAEGTGDATIVLTGFGPFFGVADNPTAAFVSDDASRERMMGLAFPGVRAGRSEALVGAQAVRHCHDLPGAARTIRLVTAVLPLAASLADALAGRYFDTDATEANFRRLLAASIAEDDDRSPAGVISLGVDSGQILRPARPSFKIETQTRGFHSGGRRGRTATDGFQRTLDLPRIFMRARSRGDDILMFDGVGP